MKQKIFLSLVAAICCVTSAWAGECIETIPAPVYMANIQFDPQTDKLSFNDTFHPEKQLNRYYKIFLYYRTENSCFYKLNVQYVYGNASSSAVHAIVQGYTANENSNGGNQEFILHSLNGQNLIESCYKHGYKDIRICIQGMYENEMTQGDWLQYEGSSYYNLGFNNYVDATLPTGIQSLSYINEVEDDDAPHVMLFGATETLKADIKAIEGYTYKWEFSNNKTSWHSVAQGTVSTVDARSGVGLEYMPTFTTGTSGNLYYRLVVSGAHMNDTSVIFRGQPYYTYTWDNGASSYNYRAGEKITLSKPADCRTYEYESELPVKTRDLGNDYVEVTMPACPISEKIVTPTYTVKFLDADYTLLKKQEVNCGDDAVAPADPSYGGYTFVGWSKDFTNVHGNMSVVAKYDIGKDYMLNTAIVDHTNNIFPFKDIASSETRAMVGDKMTFRADIIAATNATLYYETAQWLESEQRFNWIPNSGQLVDYYTTPGQSHWFDQEISICYDENTQYIHPFEYKVGFRFYMMIAGVKVYSDPYEIDVYYPITINSNVGDAVFAENTSGDYIQDVTAVLPARYNDTVRVYGINGAEGGCLSFARLTQPTRSFDYGTDENGDAFFICPGEQETINVSVEKVAVVFDGVYPTQQFDFRAQGLGLHNAYYAEIVNCGGSVQNMPADPEDAGYISKGWEAWSTDYADDAYTRVPAGVGNIIGFSAQWEEIPVAPQYTVKFFGKDSLNPIGTDQLVNEGENAVPPTAPEVAGYHFVGWNKPYTTITANTEIVALYGQDAVTWTVTYRDVNPGSSAYTKIGTETVNDGEAAQGVVPVAKEGYTFAYWALTSGSWKVREEEHADLSHVTSNMAVFARWKESVYTISYTIDGNVVQTEEVDHNNWPIWAAAIENNFTTYKPADKDYEYTFMAWNPAIAAATADATYEAQYSYNEKLHTVIFQNWDHSKLDEQQVANGSAAIAPADPTRVGYNFVGWDRSFDNVLVDLVVTAVFEKITGIEEITIEQLQMTNKFLIDGHLYIVRPDGSMYDATGVQVR